MKVLDLLVGILCGSSFSTEASEIMGVQSKVVTILTSRTLFLIESFNWLLLAIPGVSLTFRRSNA
jgi:hypothetical protein